MKRKRKRKGKREKEKDRAREIRGGNFGGDHGVGRARAAVASACRGFGGKRRAWNEGNREMERGLNLDVGTEIRWERFREIRAQGFRNDLSSTMERNSEKIFLARDLFW